VASLKFVDLIESEMIEGGASLEQMLPDKRGASLSDSSMRDFIVPECGLQPS
jgi:hypothetical protein